MYGAIVGIYSDHKGLEDGAAPAACAVQCGASVRVQCKCSECVVSVRVSVMARRGPVAMAEAVL